MMSMSCTIAAVGEHWRLALLAKSHVNGKLHGPKEAGLPDAHAGRLGQCQLHTIIGSSNEQKVGS